MFSDGSWWEPASPVPAVADQPSAGYAAGGRCGKGKAIQIDGSHHRWLEDRRPQFTLLPQVDDATVYVAGALFLGIRVLPLM